MDHKNAPAKIPLTCWAAQEPSCEQAWCLTRDAQSQPHRWITERRRPINILK